jgi:hypothetical protein
MGTHVNPNFEGLNNAERCFVCGVMNSFVIDHWVKRCVSKHVSFFYVYQIPVPRLTRDDPAFTKIAVRAARLICTSEQFNLLMECVGIREADIVLDESARLRLRCELDAMAAHLYRLTEDEFARILTMFKGVPEQTKQAALAEFVRMRESGEAAVFNPDLVKPAAPVVDPAKAVRDLIAAGESAVVEFKSSARWDVKNNKAEKFIERIIVKTVAAFLNTDGGTLVIGVEDDGNVYGLAEDYKLSGAKGRDSFENWLTQTLLKDFGKDAAGQLSTAFYELKDPDPAKPGSGDACVVTVKPSPKPRFIVENGQEQFFIRTGNATNQLKPSELLDYYKHRWPDGAGSPSP